MGHTTIQIDNEDLEDLEEIKKKLKAKSRTETIRVLIREFNKKNE